MSNPIPSPPPDASATRRGLVNLVAQTFSGLKTFAAGIMLGARLRFTGLSPGDVAIELPSGSKVTGGELEPELIRFAGGGEMSAPPVPVTLESAESGAGSLVADADGSTLRVKTIRSGGAPLSITTAANRLTLNVQREQLDDSGDGETLIVGNFGANLRVKKLQAGAGVTLTPSQYAVEIAADAPPDVTLADDGAGESLIKGATGPALELKKIRAGSGIGVTADADGVIVESTSTPKPLAQGPGGILINETGTEITVSLSTTITADVFNSRSAGWLTVGSNATRVRLGGPDILTHVLGDLVVEQGVIRSGPIDSHARMLNHGPNTWIRFYGAPGISWASGWSAPSNSDASLSYCVDAATRWVIVTGNVGTAASAVSSADICTLPTAIRPPAGRTFYAAVGFNNRVFQYAISGSNLSVSITTGTATNIFPAFTITYPLG